MIKSEPMQQVSLKGEPQVKSDKQESKDEPGVFTYDLESMQCTMHSTGQEQVAPLQSGPNGLAVARFQVSSEVLVHHTEFSNLMLLAPAEKKAKAKTAAKATAKPKVKAKKTKSKVELEPEPKPKVKAKLKAKPNADDAPNAPAAVHDAIVRNDYGIMLYNKGGKNTIGIREKFGQKKQVLSFGGTRCTKSEAEMRAIAKILVDDLNKGESMQTCKDKGNMLAGVAK